MPTLLGRFNQEPPGIDLSILEISSSEIETELEEGQWTSASDGSRDTHPIEEPPKSPCPSKLRQPTRERAKTAALRASERKDVPRPVRISAPLLHQVLGKNYICVSAP